MRQERPARSRLVIFSAGFDCGGHPAAALVYGRALLAYLARMNGRDQKTEQAEKLLARLEPMRAFLAKLTSRMQKRSFDHDDPLWQRALAAERSGYLLTSNR